MSDSRPLIVLLHGFAAHRFMMTRLAGRFADAGFQTWNWGYRSWFRPIDEHAQRLADQLAELDDAAGDRSMHFVTHSMGCIVLRAALLKYRPRHCGRWVMLAPPNRGSFAADRFAPWVGRWMSPVAELCTDEESYVNRLAIPQDIDIAVVQARLDYIVSAPLTQLAEEQDRLIVPGLHSAMLMRQDVADESVHFLNTGRFRAAEPENQ